MNLMSGPWLFVSYPASSLWKVRYLYSILVYPGELTFFFLSCGVVRRLKRGSTFRPSLLQFQLYVICTIFESDSRFLALFNLLFLLFLPARETFNSFTEEQFCEHMRRATLSEEEFTRHRQAIQELLNK